MNHICLYFQLNQSFCFQTLRFFEIGQSKPYLNENQIEEDIKALAQKHIKTTNEFLLQLIKQKRGSFKLCLHISGITLELLFAYSPEAINSFRMLADTGLVEFSGGTFSHSIASLAESNEEFKRQIQTYRNRLSYFFDQDPKLFINSDLLYSNQIAKTLEKLGYRAVLTNGTKKILGERSPNYLYSPSRNSKQKIFLRNEIISNALTELIGQDSLKYQSQTSLKFPTLINATNNEPITNIYLDYKTLGGNSINRKLSLFKKFVDQVENTNQVRFSLPSDVIHHFGSIDQLNINDPVCWTGYFHPDYFPGNELQKDAILHLFKLDSRINKTSNSKLLSDWLHLQSTNHFHLMDDNHPQYNQSDYSAIPYQSKYEAYINYMNILDDFKERLKQDQESTRKNLTKAKSAEIKLKPEK